VRINKDCKIIIRRLKLVEKKREWGIVRSVGKYRKSGDWSDYWRTKISYADDKECIIRGYAQDDIIENLSYTEALYLTLKGELPTESEARVFDAVLNAITDHQFIASNTPAARYVASAFPNSPIPGLAAGVLAFGSNTGSPQDSADLINDAYALMQKENLTEEETAKRVVNKFIAEKKRMPGFGHPFYEIDPRATAVAKVAKENGVWGPKAQLYEAIHDEFVRASGKDLPINIDGMMACVLNEMDFDPMEMAGIAVISSMPGMLAHVVEEIKEGVPLRIIPEELGAKYIGVPKRKISK